MIIPQNIIRQLLKYIMILVVQLTSIQCHIVHIGNIIAHIILISIKSKVNAFIIIIYFIYIFNTHNSNRTFNRKEIEF